MVVSHGAHGENTDLQFEDLSAFNLVIVSLHFYQISVARIIMQGLRVNVENAFNHCI